MYIYILDFTGKVFTHTFYEGFPKNLLDMVNIDGMVDYRTYNGRILDIGAPLINGMPAKIHIGFRKEHTLAVIASIRNKIISLTLFLAFSGIMIGIIVSKRLTRPLTEIAQSLRDFGNLKKRM